MEQNNDQLPMKSYLDNKLKNNFCTTWGVLSSVFSVKMAIGKCVHDFCGIWTVLKHFRCNTYSRSYWGEAWQTQMCLYKMPASGKRKQCQNCCKLVGLHCW